MARNRIAGLSLFALGAVLVLAGVALISPALAIVLAGVGVGAVGVLLTIEVGR